jgi:PiT family inorganic phosphate transporter
MVGLFAIDSTASGIHIAILLAFLAVALGFEFVNGFHDTANAVATVIYTKSLTPRVAVVWSGLCNFAGVHLGGTAVAFGIVHLLPVDMLVSIGSGPGMAMVLAVLLAAVSWNLGTWYLGLPASSSHTLVGAILGVGLANSFDRGLGFGTGVNWGQAGEVGLSLLISPLIGFSLAALLLVVLKKVTSNPELYQPPKGDQPPPFWIRSVLVLTCTGVSVAHGSNDGQKGIGLIMLILIGLQPARYAIDPSYGPRQSEKAVAAAARMENVLSRPELAGPSDDKVTALLGDLRQTLNRVSRPSELGSSDRWQLRTDLLHIDDGLKNLADRKGQARLSDSEQREVEACRVELRKATDYAPDWVKLAVAFALGAGTMIGWKRIVLTVGEKIGKSHLTYAQGASAEVVAMVTIGMADIGGLPVSTTHVLSSGVAGTMVANGDGLQYRTVRNIALAWALTLPATMSLSAVLFLVFRRVIASVS